MATYKVTSQEQGRGPKYTVFCGTLRDASEYIQARWQGEEYRDSDRDFHTDYSTYRLVGFKFSDIGRPVLVDGWREFVFDKKLV